MSAIYAITHVSDTSVQELLLLRGLQNLLDQASESLSNGDPGQLPAVSRQITLSAEEVARLFQLAWVPGSIEAQFERRKLLAKVAQQKAFCRAMLRRWRRSLMLRHQLLSLQSEAEPYTGYIQLGGFR